MMRLSIERIMCCLVSVVMALSTIPLGLMYIGDLFILRLAYLLLMIDLFGVAPILMVWVDKKEQEKEKTK